MQYQREDVTLALIEELYPLLKLHYQEIAHFQDIELRPDFDQYIRLDQSGALRVFTARGEDDALLGYAIYFIRHNIHYSTSLQAVQDILYVHPSHRGVGRKLIAYCDEALRREGVQVTYHHVKAAHDFGPLLKRMGYELVDFVYARRLD